jgi:hypothetical protein
VTSALTHPASVHSAQDPEIEFPRAVFDILGHVACVATREDARSSCEIFARKNTHIPEGPRQGFGTIMDVLRRCAVSLLLVLVLCDFATPLSPGAFRLDSHRTVEIAHHSAPAAAALGVPFVSAHRPLQSINHSAQQDPPTYRVARVDASPFRYVVPLQTFRAEPEPGAPEDH